MLIIHLRTGALLSHSTRVDIGRHRTNSTPLNFEKDIVVVMVRMIRNNLRDFKCKEVGDMKN